MAKTVTDSHRTIDAIWRIEQAKLIAVLARIVRDVGLAEDLAQGCTRRRTRTVIQVKYPGEGATPDRAPLLGLNLVMDHGWILTFAAREAAAPQISIATEGGSGTPVPDLSIEVDNLDEVHQRVLAAGSSIEYGPTSEPWGVRRFYVRDPFGRLLNILAHES